MILITVGTEKFPFNRLMGWIENSIAQNLISLENEEVVIQYGSCTIVPDNVKGFSLLKPTDFMTLVQKARIIIAHCGEGTIDLLASISKPFILVPRSYDFHEHVDDHQIELAQQLSKQGIPIANCQEDLINFLAKPFVAHLPVTPAKYYARASLLLAEEFESELVRENSSNKPKDCLKLSPVFA